MALTWRLPAFLTLGLLLVLVRPQLSTVWLWALIAAMVTSADWLLAMAPKHLDMRRTETRPVRLGEATSTTVEVSAPVACTLLIRDAWQPSAGATNNRHLLRLRKDGPRPVTTALLPRRRGDLHTDTVTVRSFGPLRFAARQQSVSVPGSVRSLPPFRSRKHLPSRLARLRDLDGRSAVRVRGAGTEFDSLREYVDGDDVRSIDWRATARNRTMVVRTWQPERDRRVVLVLDTSRTSAGRINDETRLDAAMDASLLLASLAARAGDRVDFVAGDRLVRRRLKSAGSNSIAHTLQNAMTTLEPEIAEADWAGLAGAIQQLGRQRALVVLLSTLDPNAIEQGLLPVLPVLTQHHRVVLASVQDPTVVGLRKPGDTADEVYLSAAANQVETRDLATKALLGSLGVEVIEADPEHLPPALADHYLALKAQGLL